MSPKLNDRTPINKTWDMIRKITGKGQSNGIKHIVKDGQTITNIKQISNTSCPPIHHPKIIQILSKIINYNRNKSH